MDGLTHTKQLLNLFCISIDHNIPEEVLHFVVKFCQFCDVGSLTQVISNGTLQNLGNHNV